MILDSGKSAEPTTIDFRSPEADPPPSGLELPHAAVISASTATRIARLRWCGVRRAGFMRTSFRRHLPPATLTAAAPCRPALAHANRRGGFIRCGKGQEWSHDQRSVRVARPAVGRDTGTGRAPDGDDHTADKAIDTGVGGEVHPRRGTVVGDDRRIRDP